MLRALSGQNLIRISHYLEESLKKSIEEQFLLEFNNESSSDKDQVKQWLQMYSKNAFETSKVLPRTSKLNVSHQRGEKHSTTKVLSSLLGTSLPKCIYDKEKLKESTISFSPIAIENIESIDFDIFKCEKEVGASNTLGVVSTYVLFDFGLFPLLNPRRFSNFIQEVTKGYIRKNPYHTDLHSADVLHSCYLFVKDAKLKSALHLISLDLVAFFISAMVHDYKHPGLTNGYLISANETVALTYNGNNIKRSVSVGKFPFGRNVQVDSQ